MRSRPAQAGIYHIVNRQDGKTYVGSAVNIATRWADHRKLLQANKHHGKFGNIHLQRAWNRDGAQSFDFIIVEIVTDLTILVIREQAHIDAIPPALRYNICPTAGNCLGRVVSEEGRRNISKGRAGITPSRSAEHRQHLSEALKGHTPTAATLEASAAKRRGKPLTDAHKDRVSQGLKGKKRPPRSPEHIAKLKAVAQARASNPAWRAALSATMKARKIAPSDEAKKLGGQAMKKRRVFSPEHRVQLSLAATRRHANARAVVPPAQQTLFD